MIQNGCERSAVSGLESIHFKTPSENDISFGDLGLSTIAADPLTLSVRDNFQLEAKRVRTFQDTAGVALHPQAEVLATQGFIKDDNEQIKCHYCGISPTDDGLHAETSLCAFNQYRQVGPASPFMNSENEGACCYCKANVGKILIPCGHLLCPMCCEQTLYSAKCPLVTCAHPQACWLKKVHYTRLN